MKTNFLLLIFLIKFSFYSVSQDSKWLMGYQCCSPPFGSTEINFSSGSPQVSTVNRMMPFYITNSCITDSSGNLLFYTNGLFIANGNNDTMRNGSSLCTDSFSLDFRQIGLPLVQGTLILPFNINSSRYYLIHEEFDMNDQYYRPTRLYNSVIDMSLDSGRGEVTRLRQTVLQDTLVPGLVTACRNANGRDWWVITPRSNSNLYYITLVTPYQLISRFQVTGYITHGDLYEGSGQVVFSRDGTKYARFDPVNGLVVMDFDRCSGNLYNLVHIDSTHFQPGLSCGGLAFSPSGRFLYITTCDRLFQLDMNATPLLNGLQLIAVYDGFNSPSATKFFTCKLARNDEVYITCPGGTDRLHVIKHPDSLGTSCNFEQHSFVLPRLNAATMFVQPEFSLGRELGSPCDSLQSAIETVIDRSLQLFPNPASVLLHIKLPRKLHNAICRITDISGAEIQVEKPAGSSDEFSLYVANLPNGMYFLEVTDDQYRYAGRFSKMLE